MDVEDLHNRIRKRHRHLRRWARRWPTDAWRVYDQDIPDWPWAVDLYGDRVCAQQFARAARDDDARHALVIDAIARALELPIERVHVKTRRRQRGSAQYEKLGQGGNFFEVHEGPHRFLVNLQDYLDTGLFLDHRALRRIVGQQVEALAERGGTGPPPRVLNLFCYTGAFTVWAAAAGAHTTSVDLSNTYLDWTAENLRRNRLLGDGRHHERVRSDLLRWLPQQVGRRAGSYDLAVLDPPTFSRSKKMDRDLDIQRDHPQLISTTMSLLRPGGQLLFSTNFRGFRLELGEALQEGWAVEEITDQTGSEDFRRLPHRAWRMTAA